jgi:hypothetical protein
VNQQKGFENSNSQLLFQGGEALLPQPLFPYWAEFFHIYVTVRRKKGRNKKKSSIDTDIKEVVLPYLNAELLLEC